MSAQLITQGWGIGLPITVTLPAFPSVANLPGVPQLARSALVGALTPPALGFAADPDVLWQATQSAPVWGVFDVNDDLVVDADSVDTFGWRKENRMPNYPIQEGAFGTFNRVGLPNETSVVLTKGGSLSDRTAFLQQIDILTDQQNIQLYTIRTPERSYFNVSCGRGEMARRKSANAFYFDVELYFIEIAPVAAQYSTVATPTNNAKEPSAVPAINKGLNNPQLPVGNLKNLAPWWTN